MWDEDDFESGNLPSDEDLKRWTKEDVKNHYLTEDGRGVCKIEKSEVKTKFEQGEMSEFG